MKKNKENGEWYIKNICYNVFNVWKYLLYIMEENEDKLIREMSEKKIDYCKWNDICTCDVLILMFYEWQVCYCLCTV